MLENQTMGSSSSHLVPFISDSSLTDMVHPSLGSGSFSEMVSHEHCRNSEDGALGALLNVKRKRKNVEVEQKNDQKGDISEYPKEDENKSKCANSRSKQGAKQVKITSNDTEPSKENYILLRAKRGQATNSHSLAERLRREKISERMKLLQELVPGCNKITGKAMMLDEIINYVQSLQQQVEFLSMKLATVNPELNMDIERLLCKDILHPQVGIPRPGIGQGLSSSHVFPRIAPPFHPLPPNLWNTELQSIPQMGFDSNPSFRIMGTNGLSKTEL